MASPIAFPRALLLAAAVSATASLSAQTTIQWNTTPLTGGTWSTTTNWVGGNAPDTDTEIANLSRDWSTAPTFNLGAATTINGLTYDDTGTSGDVTGTIANGGNASNTLTFAGTTPTATVASGNTLNITATLGGSGSFTKAGAGSLVLSNPGTLSSIAINAGVLAYDRGSTSYSLSQSLSGLGTFEKRGSGTLTLTGIGASTLANVGAISIRGGSSAVGGILRVEGSSALGSGAIDHNKAGTEAGRIDLALSGSNNFTNVITFSSANAINATTNVGSAHIRNVSGANTLAGNLTLDTTGGDGINLESAGTAVGDLLTVSGNIAVTVTSSRKHSLFGAGNGVVSGVISDPATASTNTALVKAGAGTWSLTGTNTFTGNITVVEGVLSVGSGGSAGQLQGANSVTMTGGLLHFNSTAAQAHSGIISGDGAVRKSGSGALTLSGNNSYVGGFTIDGGSVLVGSVGGLGGATNTLALNGGAISSNNTNARAITAAGASTIGGNLTLGNGTNTGALTFANNFDLGGSTRVLTVASSVTLSGALTNGGLSKAGGSTLTLSGSSNTYSGGTTVSAGTLAIAAVGALPSSGTITLSGGTLRFTTVAQTVSSAINVTGSATIYAAAIRPTLQTGAITLSNGVTLTFNSGGEGTNSFSVGNGIGLAPGATGANLTVTHDSSNTSNYNGAINLGTGVLTKGSTAHATFGSSASVIASSIANNGAGNLTFSGQLTTGTITHGSAPSTTTGSVLTLSHQLNSISSIQVNGGDLRLSNSGAAGGAAITLASASNAQVQVDSGTFDVDSNLTISGGTGSGVSGQGALWYSAASGTLTWSGDISVLGGMGLGGHFATNGGELVVSGNVSYASSNVVVRTGNVTFSGAGNDFGQLELAQGRIRLGAANSLTAGSLVKVGNNAFAASFDLNGFNQSVGSLNSASTAAGGASVTNNGASAATLTLTGRTVASVAHTVVDVPVSTTLAIAPGSSQLGLVLDAGANVPVVNVAGALTLSVGLTSAQGFVKSGAGILTVSSSQAASLSGGVTISEGIIQLVGGANGRLGSSPSVVLGSATASGKLVLGSAAGSSNQTLSSLSQSGLGGSVTGGNSTHFSVLTLDLSSGLSLGTFLGGSTDSERRVSLTKAGNATLTLSGANDYAGVTTVSAGTLAIGHSGALGSGQVIVSTGGTLDLGGLNIANVVRAEGGTIINGSGWTGSVLLNGAVDNAYLAALPGNTLTVSAGSTLDLTGVTSLGGKSIVYTGGTLAGDNASLLIEVGDGVSLGSAFGTGTAVIKSGRTVTFNNFFTQDVRYEGGTLVNLGNYEGTITVAANSTLDLDGADNTPAETAVTINVDAGSTLKGTGTFAGGTISGTHAPGNSPGVQTSQGNLTYAAGSAVEWELVANDVLNMPVVHDQIVVNGNLNFAGSTALSLVFDGAGSAVDWTDTFWDTPQSWVIYDVSGSVSGIVNLVLSANDWNDSNDVSLSAARSGFTFAIGQSGTDVVLNYQPVPEPSTYGLILGGLALAGAALRRRRKA